MYAIRSYYALEPGLAAQLLQGCLRQLPERFGILELSDYTHIIPSIAQGDGLKKKASAWEAFLMPARS